MTNQEGNFDEERMKARSGGMDVTARWVIQLTVSYYSTDTLPTPYQASNLRPTTLRRAHYVIPTSGFQVAMTVRRSILSSISRIIS